jgi:hypothetical protein
MSDPAAKETRAMAQTVHPLEFQLPNFQQLRVMEVSFFILTKVLNRCSGGSGAKGAGSLLFRPLIHPVVNGLVVESRILWLPRVVGLVREIQHLGRHSQHLQRGEELKRLRHIASIVELAMDNKRRRLEILGKQVRRPLLVRLSKTAPLKS